MFTSFRFIRLSVRFGLVAGCLVALASGTALGQSEPSSEQPGDVAVSASERAHDADAARRRTRRPPRDRQMAEQEGTREGPAGTRHSPRRPRSPEEGAAMDRAAAHGGPADRESANDESPHGGEAHAAAGHAAAGHAAAGHAAAGHGGEAHVPSFSDINWATGLLGESDTEPSGLLWRPKGMPVPFLATLLNWGALVAMIVVIAKKQLPGALRRRKEQIVEGMQAAARMKDESEARLAEYQSKLDNLSQEIARVRADMVRAGELERERILAEAVERRTRMERDARHLVEMELQAAEEALRREVAGHAMRFAEETIRRALSPVDQQRLFDEGLVNLQKLGARSLGGQV